MADETAPDGATEELAPEDAATEAAEATLLADIEALVEDGKTYAEAELAFQKTRLLYASGKARSAAIYTGVAAIFVTMAVVALVLGAVLALTPLFGAIGAAGTVFAVLLVFALVLVLLAKAKIGQLIDAFEDEDGQA